MTKLKLHFFYFLSIFPCLLFAQSKADTIPSKEEIMSSIMDVNVSEEEAIELLSKYYPELLNPVVEAKKDFERANTVQNIKEEGFFYTSR